MKTLDQIAAELQGYDPQALSVDAALAFLQRLAQPVADTEEVELVQALGRVLAQDVVSPLSVPPHDNSAMDGYAFDGAALDQPDGLGHIWLRAVPGSALAGKAWAGTVGAGECVRIMTGAIMPAGLDTVAPQELCHTESRPDGSQWVRLPASALRRGDNRRLLGEDLMQGQPALRQGQTLGPAALGLLASLGLPRVRVRRRLKVAYFSTGDEILSLGEAPREGAVYDSNRYTVFGLLTRLGVQVLDLGVVGDDPQRLEATFRRAAAEADAVITSGGVSVGEADHTKAMMRQLGDVAFWRIAMRPGRPMAVGRMASTDPQRPGALLLGLPGNPVAVMVTFLAFVRPTLLRLMGCAIEAPLYLKARSAEALRKKPGRTEYQRGLVTSSADGGLQVRLTGSQGSGVLRSMVEANGLVVLHHVQGNVAVGDEVDVMVFDGVI